MLTGDIYFGLIDNQTRPARRSVTAKERDNISALDCELKRRKEKKKNQIGSGYRRAVLVLPKD